MTKKTLFQRGPEDYTLEVQVIEVETERIVTKRLFDVLVYDKTPEGKPIYVEVENLKLEVKKQ